MPNIPPITHFEERIVRLTFVERTLWKNEKIIKNKLWQCKMVVIRTNSSTSDCVSYVNYMSKVSYVSYLSYVNYVSCMSYARSVGYVSCVSYVIT